MGGLAVASEMAKFIAPNYHGSSLRFIPDISIKSINGRQKRSGRHTLTRENFKKYTNWCYWIWKIWYFYLCCLGCGVSRRTTCRWTMTRCPAPSATTTGSTSSGRSRERGTATSKFSLKIFLLYEFFKSKRKKGNLWTFYCEGAWKFQNMP